MGKEQFKTVLKQGYALVEEKKSEFIANVFPVETEEEALEQLNAIKNNIKMQDITVLHTL